MKPSRIKETIRTKQEFITFCSKHKAKTYKELSEKLDISLSSMLKLNGHFGVNKDDRNDILSANLTLDEVQSRLSNNIDMDGRIVSEFEFYGVTFYIVSGESFEAPLIFRSKGGVLKPISETDDGSFYFYLVDGSRKVIAKHRFMYCFFNGLKSSPKGDISCGDKWYNKRDLELINVTNGVSDKEMRRFVRKGLRLRKKGLRYRTEYLDYIDAFFDTMEKGA